MSTVGKVFIVLNLFLAGLFLGYASTALASSEDFKDQLEVEQAAHAASRAELEARVSGLSVEVKQNRERADGLANERDQEKARADRSDEDLRDARATVDSLTASLQGVETSLGSLDGKVADIDAAKDSAVEARVAAESERDTALDERDEAQAAQRAAEDQARQLDQQIAKLEMQLVASSQEVASLTTQLKTVIVATGVDPASIISMPSIDAAVVKVDMSLAPGLVALNKGKGQGVEKGFVFDIYSQDVYKGQAVVQDVSENVSSALIKLAVAGQTIRTGDRATTSL